MNSFHIEETEVVLKTHIFNVEKRLVRGQEIFERSVVTHPGAVAILAVNDSGKIGVSEQYRATFDQRTIEIPAGTCDVPGEDLMTTARRELEEELGVVGSKLSLLGQFMNSPGWTNQVMHLFYATDLSYTSPKPQGPEERDATIEWLSPIQLKSRLQREPAIDSTMAAALNKVYGNFFD